ncbi:MAG: hypothetical protein N2327_06790 [Caldimicrobium sp.]|nr:hypothetical protein [Caldimicrobium sp.]MCX7874119.1 hypothetical protein [Caldimicrobium sp.]MDW8093746.1 hypothetical protein [Caldimicrobium sp.]
MSYPDRMPLTTHVGSLPYTKVDKAIEVALRFDIPAWPQLPKYKEEGMLWQFVQDLPGFDLGKEILITTNSDFEEKLLQFYETYVEIMENKNYDLLKRFWTPTYSKTFFPFLEKIKALNPLIVKGQITGPFTLGTALKTQNGENLIFSDELRDLIVKFLIVKALAQGYYLKEISPKVIIFIDEPGLSGFGSSGYITLGKELVKAMLEEIFEALHSFELISGIHICANTSWDLVLESSVKIINFDSYSFFDRLIIYREALEKFLDRKETLLAWGVVPTDQELLNSTSREELAMKWKKQIEVTAQILNLDFQELLKRSLITPTCGMGSLAEETVKKVVDLLNSLKLVFW